MLKILFVKKKFLSQELAKESLDMVLAGVDLDLKISLLFMDDAVFHLMKSESSSAYHVLTISEIEKIYVAQESLQARNLTMADLIMPVKIVSMAQVVEVVSLYDVVM